MIYQLLAALFLAFFATSSLVLAQNEDVAETAPTLASMATFDIDRDQLDEAGTRGIDLRSGTGFLLYSKGQGPDLSRLLTGDYDDDFKVWPKRNQGLRQQQAWIRLAIFNPSDSITRAVLVFDHLGLDELNLYRQGELQVLSKTGARARLQRTENPHLSNSLPVEIKPYERAIYYIQINTQGELKTQMRMLAPRKFRIYEDTIKTLVLGFSVAFLLIFVLSLRASLMIRTWDYVCYCLFILSSGVRISAAHGMLSLMPLGGWQLWQHVGALALPASIVAAACFTMAFFRLNGTRSWSLRMMQIFAIVGVLQCGLQSFAVTASFARESQGPMLLLMSFAMLGFGLKNWVRGVGGTKYFVLGWGIGILSMALAGLWKVEWIKDSSLALPSSLGLECVQLLLLGCVFADRARFARRAHAAMRVADESFDLDSSYMEDQKAKPESVRDVV